MSLTIVSRQKSDFCGKFKLDLIKIAYLGFVVKMSWKCYECNTSSKIAQTKANIALLACVM